MKLEPLRNWTQPAPGDRVNCLRCRVGLTVTGTTMAIVKAGTPDPVCDCCAAEIEERSGGKTAGGDLIP
jgi:hypothetical protein